LRVLLDTHAVLWWLSDDERLSQVAREAIATAERPAFSAGSILEVAIKSSIGKLTVPTGWTDRLFTEGFVLLAIAPAHGARLAELPFVTVDGRPHRDPLDRLLVAQAEVERLPIITRDRNVAAHGIPTVW
jgi:PIN domain nuclease of toxin-antitoxin system